MHIPTKDAGDVEIPPEFLAELNAVYYGVMDELGKMRIWCLANPDRRKTKRGLNRFVANWISRACVLRPRSSDVRSLVLDVREDRASSKESRLAHLAELKGALCK